MEVLNGKTCMEIIEGRVPNSITDEFDFLSLEAMRPSQAVKVLDQQIEKTKNNYSISYAKSALRGSSPYLATLPEFKEVSWPD